MTRYYLRCLGQPELRSPTGEPVRFRTRKHLALLVYFAVEPRIAHPRDLLTDLLWPNAGSSEGRHSLATALSVLRGKLGAEAFDARRDHVRFVCREVALDLERLEGGDVLATDLGPALEVSGFLEGFDVPDAPEFMLWRDRQRARLLPAVSEALVRQMDRCRRTGDFRGIEVLADRMLAIDELSEAAVRAKMEARAFAGDRLTALKIFEGWKERLYDSLEAAPSELLEGMAVRLRRRGWERTTADPIPSVPTDHWKDRPFVGRSEEYRVLYEGWERTRGGSGRHALVLGDSGVGKTTLVERLVTAASLEGAVSSRVQCYEVERQIPYAAVGSLVEGLLERPGASGTPPEWLAELALAVPAVRQRFANLPPAVESRGETARVRLAEAVHELVVAVAEEAPVILVVDDLHLADDASIAVLHLLLRRVQQHRVMALFTLRPAELDPTSQGARLRENGARIGLTELELRPMSEDESGHLLASLLPAGEAQPTPAARRAIVRASAGYPMVLELLAQDWQANGDACLALSVDAMTEELAHSVAPAEAYRRIIARLVQQLDPTTRNVLNLAAVLGARLNDMRMYRLVDLTIGQTLAAMARLSDLRILRDGPHGLEFTNELVRAQVYLSVPSPLRRVLHGSIADRLLAAEREDQHVPGLEIAWHCIRSGRGEEATPYILSGAREAIERGAPMQAEHALSTALPDLSGPARRKAYLLLGEALQEQARWQESLDALRQTDQYLDEPEAELARCLELLAARHLEAVLSQETVGSIAELETLALRGKLPATRVRAAANAAALAGYTRDRELLQKVLVAADSIEDEHLSIHDASTLALVKAKLAYQLRDRLLARKYLATASATRPHQLTGSRLDAQIRTGTAILACSEGDYTKAVELLKEAYEIANRLGNEREAGGAAANLSLCCGRLGDYTGQLRWGEIAGASLRGKQAPFGVVQAAYGIALAYAMMGEQESANDTLASHAPYAEQIPAQWIRQAWALYSADVRMILRQERAGYALAENTTCGPDAALHDDGFAGPYARWTARVGLLRNGYRKTRERLDMLLARLEEFDAIDQAEIDCAILWLEEKNGRQDALRASQLAERLARLPRGVSTYLSRLGMLTLR